MKADFILEIGCEELPASEIKKIVVDLEKKLLQQLDAENLKYHCSKIFGTPRRLAVIVQALDSKTAATELLMVGPHITSAFVDGKPTPAALGFAKKCGTKVQNLLHQNGKLAYKQSQPSRLTKDLLLQMVNLVVNKLQLSKRMRWGANKTEFLRPVHWIQMLYNNQAVEGEVLGLNCNNITYGHRFYANKPLHITNTNNYISLLKENFVLADFEERKNKILTGVEEICTNNNLSPVLPANLLAELVGLVEWPVVMLGEFAPEFLQLPQEVLITSMQTHQKYIPLLDDKKLSNKFILISNIEAKNSDKNTKNWIVDGNKKVIQARLQDAHFFWKQDLKVGIDSMTLQNVIYHKLVGSMVSKIERIATIGNDIAQKLELNDLQLTNFLTASRLCKLDLVSKMVIEFTQLQGVMGSYYATHAGYDAVVCDAIRTHYLPTHAGDSLPTSPVAIVLALADKLDTLCGMIKINQKPTGDKDPFALRRAALGICRILVENKIDINLFKVIEFAFASQPAIADKDTHLKNITNKKIQGGIQPVPNNVNIFILQRFRSYLLELQFSTHILDAVLAKPNQNSLFDSHQRIIALTEGMRQPETLELIGAYKRINNILKGIKLEDASTPVNIELLAEKSELELLKICESIQQFNYQNDYCILLTKLTCLTTPINNFFDKLIVLVDDKLVRQNRIALLNKVKALFDNLADLSKLPLESSTPPNDKGEQMCN